MVVNSNYIIAIYRTTELLMVVQYTSGTSSSTVKVYAENSILQGNSASRSGGGMYKICIKEWNCYTNKYNICIELCWFDGGGMYISGDSSDVTLRQCSFISNTASDNGHAIYTWSSPTIAVINTYFSNPNDNNDFYHMVVDHQRGKRVRRPACAWKHLLAPAVGGQWQQKVEGKVSCNI